MLGLVCGIASGPCTFAYMAPVLGVAFKLAHTHPLYGALLLFAYGAGQSAVIVLAGTCAGMVQHYVNWNQKSQGTTIVKKACGVLVLIGGLHLVYTAH